MSRLSFEKKVLVVSHLTDHGSVRGTQRKTGVEKKTIGRLLLAVGDGCARLHDRIMRGLRCNIVQLDEQYSYIHTKQRNLKPDDPPHWGETWTFVGQDVNSRAVVSYVVGKRTSENTYQLALDLHQRVDGSPEIWADGFTKYIDAIQFVFGDGVNFGRFIKPKQEEYEDESLLPEGPRRMRHKGEHNFNAIKVAQLGNPNLDKLTTNTIERLNGTTRAFQARLTRRTYTFSKSEAHHRAAMQLHFAYYNFCWCLRTLRVTPAMQLGVTDHVWKVSELVKAALEEPTPPPLGPAPPPPRGTPRGDPLPHHSRWHAVEEDRIPEVTRAPGTGSPTKPSRPKLTVVKGGREG